MPWLERWQAILASADGTDLPSVLAEDVTLHTPVVIQQAYHGRELVAATLQLAIATLAPLTITDVLRNDAAATAAVAFAAQVGDLPLQGIWYLAGAGEQVQSVTLLIRPLKALQHFVAVMAAKGAKPAQDFLQGNLW